MRKLSLFSLLLAATVGFAADPAPVKFTPAKAIKFPDFPPPKVDPVKPAPPAPAPKVDPLAPVTLNKGQFYVIASPKPLLLLPTGTGEVSVATRKPPFMLPVASAIGVWPVDPKDPEFVLWGEEYPYIYVVKAAKSGDVGLLVLPTLNDVDEKTKQQIPLTAKDVVRKSFLVDDGTGPRPPPAPVDPPVIDPDLKPIPNPAKGFRVMFIYETESNLTQEQSNIVGSTKIVEYLNTRCAKDANGRPEWRKWDKGTISQPGGLDKESALWKQLWADSKDKIGKLPQVVIVSDQAGVTREWPATEAAMLALLKQYGG